MRNKIIWWSLCCLFLLFIVQCKSDTGKPQPRDQDTGSQQDPPEDNQQGNLYEHTTENLVIVTIDGFRWQEVFKGADSALLRNINYNSTEGQSVLLKRFWSSDVHTRRKELAPFFWNDLAEHGKLYGNRSLGCNVNVKNPYWISYPGYNEIFTGYPDPDIKSNDEGYNINKNVLEFINQQTGYKDSVVAFTSASTFFKRILNSKRNGLPVNGIKSNKQTVQNDLGKSVLQQVNKLPLYAVNAPNSENTAIVYAAAKSYLMENHPRVLYIAFSLTDHYAHKKKYNCYLEVAHNINVMLEDLWNYLQNDSFYQGKTTLFICPDHGRGIGDDWTAHGSKLVTAGHPHSDEIWFAVMGPDTRPAGEVSKKQQLLQNQFARTMAALLGMHFVNSQHIGNRIESVMDKDEH